MFALCKLMSLWNAETAYLAGVLVRGGVACCRGATPSNVGELCLFIQTASKQYSTAFRQVGGLGQLGG